MKPIKIDLREGENEIKRTTKDMQYFANDEDKFGQLILTNQRLIFKCVAAYHGGLDLNLELSQLVRCELRSKGFLESRFDVVDIYKTWYTFNVSWLQNDEWAKAIQKAIVNSRAEAESLDKAYKTAMLKQASQPQPVQQTAPATTVQQEDPLDKIRKLKQLLDEGIISEAEFNENKKKLLGDFAGGSSTAKDVNASKTVASANDTPAAQNGKVKYEVFLLKVGKNDIDVVNAIREITGSSPFTAISMTRDLPRKIWETDNIDAATITVNQLKAAGADAEMRPVS